MTLGSDRGGRGGLINTLMLWGIISVNAYRQEVYKNLIKRSP